jgi:hypothetical protein
MQTRHFPDGTKTNNNLDNLSWATCETNQRDKIFHGTDSRGERNGNAKLTWNDAKKIRRLFGTGRFTKMKLAAMFGIGRSSVLRIIRNENWKREGAVKCS